VIDPNQKKASDLVVVKGQTLVIASYGPKKDSTAITQPSLPYILALVRLILVFILPIADRQALLQIVEEIFFHLSFLFLRCFLLFRLFHIFLFRLFLLQFLPGPLKVRFILALVLMATHFFVYDPC